MNTTVYLVIWLDFSTQPLPTVVEVGVYGEAHPSTASFTKRYPVMLTSSRGSTFENAVENLRRYCSSTPHMRWALPHIEKETRRC